MTRHRQNRPLSRTVPAAVAQAVMLLVLLVQVCGAAATPLAAEDVLREVQSRRGLIVHLGCGTGENTVRMQAHPGTLVHGLDHAEPHIAAARARVLGTDRYGTISFDTLRHDTLPYIDQCVNVIVAEQPGLASRDELLRVLIPQGVLYLRTKEGWTRTVKPRPADIDEWTHFLHGPDNNAVAQDLRVAPPTRLQWAAGPKHARSHDHLASLSTAVSAGGRLFMIVDEGPTASVSLEPQWMLVARDAYNGVVLWTRRLPDWQYHLRAFRSGPSNLARRLVAVGDEVYVTLGIEAPVTALDAATGKETRTYDGTEHAREFIVHDGTLFVAVADGPIQQSETPVQEGSDRPGFTPIRSQRPAVREYPAAKRLLAINVATGRQLWQAPRKDTITLMPTAVAACGNRVYFQNAEKLVCLECTSGRVLWRADRPASRVRPGWSAPTLVAHDKVVLSADRPADDERSDAPQSAAGMEWIVTSGGKRHRGELIAFSAEDGRRLWSCSTIESFCSPTEVMVADDLVWTDFVMTKPPGTIDGRDLLTGKIKRSFPKKQRMGHGRCHRSKATSRYLVLGRNGVELTDLTTGENQVTGWARGGCQYGVLPCNGFIYVPPHSCACSVGMLLHGFNCLAPEPRPEQNATIDDRLERGPAYDAVPDAPSTARDLQPKAWPTYRHDPARSGYTPGAVPEKLHTAWEADVGGTLSAPIVADGNVMVADVHAHTLYALDAGTGEPVWSRTVGGRVDSPPTFWNGKLLFGSADGYVYCLRASDGVLVWRLRAGPTNERLVSYGQIESVWPVPGNVLVVDGTAYFTAGHAAHMDGGCRLLAVDVQTGRPTVDYAASRKVGHPDIPSFDGESVYVGNARFSVEGSPRKGSEPHLFTHTGFLDGSWWHRTYWLVAGKMLGGYTGWPQMGARLPAGRLLVMDDDAIYGYGRSDYVTHGSHIGFDGAMVHNFWGRYDKERRFVHHQAFSMSREAARPLPRIKDFRTPPEPKDHAWTQRLDILARAMVLTPDLWFMAGPPDFFKTDDPVGTLQGTRGGSLLVLGKADGKQRHRVALESPPVWDGMAAAYGRLYLTCMNGNVICYAGQP